MQYLFRTPGTIHSEQLLSSRNAANAQRPHPGSFSILFLLVVVVVVVVVLLLLLLLLLLPFARSKLRLANKLLLPNLQTLNCVTLT